MPLLCLFSDRRRGFEGCSQRSVCSRRIVRSSGWPTSYRHIGQYKSIAVLGVSSEFVGDCSCVLKSPARLFQSNDKKYQQVVSRSELPSDWKTSTVSGLANCSTLSGPEATGSPGQDATVKHPSMCWDSWGLHGSIVSFGYNFVNVSFKEWTGRSTDPL